MNVASLSLCKELYELSGWAGLNDLPRTRDMLLDYFSGGIPQYTLSYLLRKLPPQTHIKKEFDASPELPEETPAHYRALYDTVDDKHYWLGADTPEDAACKLAIELFKQDVFKASVVQGFMTHSITTEELDRVDECMDMLFTDINLIVPNEALIGAVGLQSQMQIKKAVKEDYRKLSDAISALRKHSEQ